MKARILISLALLTILLVGLTGGATAQGNIPPSTPTPYHPLRPPFTEPDKTGGPNENPQAIALGQPGTSFRFVKQFGVTQTPYIVDTTHINRPQGLFMDGSDNLYVVEEQGYRLLRYNSSGANTLSIGKAGVSYTDNYVFSSSNDVTVDHAGNIWVADANRVVEYDSGGTFVQQIPADEPWNSGDDNGHFNDVRGVAFDTAGKMFVSDSQNQRIQVYTFSGSDPVYSATIGVTGASGADANHFNTPYRIAVDGSDRLYVVDNGNNRVQRCIYSGGWSCTTIDGGLNNPQGITVDGSNNVYIADTNNGRVRKCSSGGVCTDFLTGTDGLFDLAVDSHGNVYGAAAYEGFVNKYDPGGVDMGAFVGVPYVHYLTDGYHYNRPRVALDKSGNIIIVEEAGQRLLKLDSKGKLLWTVGVPGLDLPQDNTHFNYPHGVAVDKSGKIYVANSNQVQIFTSAGKYSARLGTGAGTGDYQFNWVTGVAVDNSGNIYVADFSNQRVQIYNKSLVFIGRIGVTGQCGSANDHLCNPIAVEVDSTGNIYVTDAGNKRLQKFNKNRQWQMTIGSGTRGDAFDQFNWPEDVTVDAQGKIYVTDWANDRVQVFDPSGAYLTTIGGAWGSTSGEFMGVPGVAVDSKGNVYVSDWENARIQVFAPGVPGWVQSNINGFGDRNNWAINRMSVFGDYLYASVNNESLGGEVWRTVDGNAWTKVSEGGFGNTSNNGILLGDSFNGYLYAGTSNLDTGSEIWRCALCDGSDWEQVADAGLGDGENTTFERVVVLENSLFATADNTSTGVEVWKSSTGDPGSWTQSNLDGFGDPNNTGLWAAAVFNGSLYTATAQWGAYLSGTQTGVEVWRTHDGTTWTQVNSEGFGDSANISPWLETFNGSLYALLYNDNTGAQVWHCAICDGSDWSQVVGNGFGDGNNAGGGFMLPFGNQLYAGISNNVTGTQVWRTSDGVTWSPVNVDGFGDSINGDVVSGAVFNYHLFLGTRNYSGWANPGDGGEVWQYVTPYYSPILLTPAHGIDLQNNLPSFTWKNIPGVTKYKIQIGKDALFSSLVGTYSVKLPNYTPKLDLPAAQTLYWRVQIVKSGVANPWSEVRSLHTANPPSTPVLLSPKSKSTVTGYTPTLLWKISTLPASTLFAYYQVQVATSADFSAPSLVVDDTTLTDINVPQYITPTLASATTFYWRVRAVNTVGSDHNFSDWSKVSIFKTK